jgi:putative hydrolases of HD superfamily
MQKDSRDLELLYEIGTIRNINRAWRQFFGQGFANLAEHHFRVAWIALLLAKREGKVDEGKILKMALCHDLSESRTGDVHHISRQYTQRDEHKAIKDVFNNTALGEEMVALWNEYEERKTLEAKIVKDADWLDVDLELREQATMSPAHTRAWEKQRQVMYRHLHTKSGKQLWKEIQKSDPLKWHMTARSRYTEGDMKSSK